MRLKTYQRILITGIILAIVVTGCGGSPAKTVEPVSINTTEESTGEANTAETNKQDTEIAQRMAPDFTLQALDGSELKLSDYQGDVVLINFWASWCPPCNAEMPALNTYYEAHKDEGFTIIGVNVKESTATVSKFVEEKGLSFPIALDENSQIAAGYGATGLPTSFFVGRDGEMLGYWPGILTEEMLEESVTPLLQE